jgi:hypothetical protein
MCRAHWFRLPAGLRARILDTYLPGQTAATAPPEYLEALTEALNFARNAAALERGGPVPLADRPETCPAGCGHSLEVHSPHLGCWCGCTYRPPAAEGFLP